jgi:hypothetical protein
MPYEPGRRYHQLVDRAHKLGPIRAAVVHPCDGVALEGAFAARDRGLIPPLLVGPRAKIERAAAEARLALDGGEIVDVPHSHAAAEAVRLAGAKKVEVLIKGSLHADELVSAMRFAA